MYETRCNYNTTYWLDYMYDDTKYQQEIEDSENLEEYIEFLQQYENERNANDK